jgi:hypothetical protein
VSSNGSTVAFGTSQALMPTDVNRKRDIYEWRNGSPGLVTDGVTEFKTGFAAPLVSEIDADGSSIFFTVAAPNLTGFEQDGLANLYDARIGGGFIPPSPPAHCTEDSCQGPLQGSPPLDRPGSSSLVGAGNQVTGAKPRRPCARKHGKARRRCMRKHRKRSQKARTNRIAGRIK